MGASSYVYDPEHIGGVDREATRRARDEESYATKRIGGWQPGRDGVTYVDPRSTGYGAQINEGVAQQQGALRAQAVGGGANPAALRGAQMAGADVAAMGQGAYNQALQAEQMGLQGLELDRLGRRAEYELASQQMENEWLQAMYNYMSDRRRTEAEDYASSQGSTGRIVGGLASGMGGVAGAMSDRSLKEQIRQASPQQLQEALRSVGTERAGELRPAEADQAAYGSYLEGSERAEMPLAMRRSAEDTIEQPPPPGALWEMDAYGQLHPVERPARPAPAPAQPLSAGQIGRALDQSEGQVYGELAANTPTYTSEYKPQIQGSPLAPDGGNVGPMAQDLERSELGRRMVVDTPAGKMVDTRKAAIGSLGMAGEAYRKAEETDRKVEQALRGGGAMAPQERQAVQDLYGGPLGDTEASMEMYSGDPRLEQLRRELAEEDAAVTGTIGANRPAYMPEVYGGTIGRY